MKLPTWAEIKFASLMSLVTTFFVTFVLTSVNLGFSKPHFFFFWMRSWFIAGVMVALFILFVAPIIRKLM